MTSRESRLREEFQMMQRCLTSIGVLTIVAVAMLPPAAAAQGERAVGAGARPAAKPYTPSKTAWGDPDLQGIWLNATITPLERPTNLGDKAFLTAEEAAAIEKQTLERRAVADNTKTPGQVGAYNDFWMDSGTKVVPTRQTSLVVAPSNGRIPFTPEAEKVRDSRNSQSDNSYEHMSVWDRCITRGMPGAMIPAGYNNAYQIMQIPGYVVILHEMIHEVRIIPVDKRQAIGSTIPQWLGDSRGRWEGNTLVVETKNFSRKGWLATSAASGRLKGIPQSENLRVVERFSLADNKTILYEATLEDQAMFKEPWKLSIPLSRDQDYKIYEYACHEGNQAVPNILRGARAAEKASASR
jgi:hypothetical protein